jgi:gamma-glutamyltranspeptidase / glutathione hydrolase
MAAAAYIRGVSAPFSWDLPYAWPRKPLLAANVVATSQPLAAQAGLRMIADGGNAVDAILATAITLTLVEPVSNGTGSDAFAIVWDGSELHGLNASGRSPAAWTPQYFDGGAVPGVGRTGSVVGRVLVAARCLRAARVRSPSGSWPGLGQAMAAVGHHQSAGDEGG